MNKSRSVSVQRWGTRFLLLCPLVLLAGCSQERIAALEKQNQELTAKLERNSSFNLQAKCAAQADVRKTEAETFARNNPPRPDINVKSHYNARVNRCFVEIDRLTAIPPASLLFINNVQDAFENKQYAELDMEVLPHEPTHVVNCEMTKLNGEKVTCQSKEEFQNLIKELMEN